MVDWFKYQVQVGFTWLYHAEVGSGRLYIAIWFFFSIQYTTARIKANFIGHVGRQPSTSCQNVAKILRNVVYGWHCFQHLCLDFFLCPFCAVIGNLGKSFHLYISLYFLAQERGTCVEEMEEPTWDSTRRMWGDLHALGSEGWCCTHWWLSPFLFPSLAVCRNDVCYFFGCLPCSAPPPSLSMQDAQKQPAQLALCLLEHGEAWWNHSHK